MFEGFTRERIEVNGIGLHVVHRGNGGGNGGATAGGSAPAVLLLHGYPQSHVMWHKVAPALARAHAVVAPDLRGYGDSDKPKPAPGDLAMYCKRTTANDIVAAMDALGHARWHVVGHDRGARVGHRMALDHPERVASFVSLDVVSSQAAFEGMDAALAFSWFHWNLMRQPHPLPETIIGRSVKTYFDFLMDCWCSTPGALTPEAYAEYERCFCNDEAVASTCADYRAIELDLVHDDADRGRKLACPVLVLWGTNMPNRPGWQTGGKLDILETWRERAEDVRGHGLDCGHFLPEERPAEVLAALEAFFMETGAARSA